jgi:NADH-quinone oxidoreductase subunit L
MVALISIILLAPLAAFAFFAILSLTGRNFARQDYISTLAMLIAFGCSLFLFLTHVNPDSPAHASVEWIRIGEVSFSMGFYFDSVTAIMLLVVTIVSSLVHIFSIGYMHGDPRYPRYFAFLSLFSFSMLFLVVSDTLLGLYIGWELVGLCSYLLIGFWFEKDSAADACKKAFLTTRVGDVGMFIGMMMLFTKFDTLALYGDGGIFQQASNLTAADTTWLSIAGVLIFCGAIGKSAQVPLHTWLPDAMEGPTPVSALIHAATMVAAGVYLAARMVTILTPDSSLVIAYIGGITAIVAATIAIVRFDIKRVLAYSTISQLGYMMLAIGAGSYVAGLFHLTTHAFFKALLFLGSGSVIHAFHAMHAHHDDHGHAHNHEHGHNGDHDHEHDHDSDHGHDHDHEHGDHDHEHGHEHESDFETFGIPADQDMRNMGGLRHKMPTTFWTMLIATLAISGVPFLFSGFYSKDAILGEVLGTAMAGGSVHYYILFGVALCAAGITAFYMFRLIFMTFFGAPRNQQMYDIAEESPPSMKWPLIILAVLSISILGKFPINKGLLEKYAEQPHAHALASEHAMQGDRSESSQFVQVGISDAHAAEEEAHDDHGGEGGHGVAHTAHNIAMILSIIIATLGIGLSYLFYYRRTFSAEAVARTFRPIYNLFWNKYYFDEFYNGVLVGFTVWGSRVLGYFDLRAVDGIVNGVGFTVRAIFSALIGWIDNTIVDGIVNWVGQIIWSIGGRVRRIQTGMIQSYLLIILGGIVLLILIFHRLL